MRAFIFHRKNLGKIFHLKSPMGSPLGALTMNSLAKHGLAIQDQFMIYYLVQTSSGLVDIAILIARVFIGLCFVMHGLGKLGLIGTGNMQGFVGWLKGMGLPFAELQARLAMMAEIGGGVMIAFGLLTRVGLVLCFFTMVMAVLLGHRKAGYLITNNPPGYEYAMNLAVICAVLFLLGPGSYSFDYFLLGLLV